MLASRVHLPDSRTLRKGEVMEIIGALYGRGIPFYTGSSPPRLASKERTRTWGTGHLRQQLRGGRYRFALRYNPLVLLNRKFFGGAYAGSRVSRRCHRGCHRYHLLVEFDQDSRRV